MDRPAGEAENGGRSGRDDNAIELPVEGDAQGTGFTSERLRELEPHGRGEYPEAVNVSLVGPEHAPLGVDVNDGVPAPVRSSQGEPVATAS